jgi:conjugal transfer pilus assembly protein TraK
MRLNKNPKIQLRATALFLAMTACVNVSANEEIQIPGMNMPVAASVADSAPRNVSEPAAQESPRIVDVKKGVTEDIPAVPSSVVPKSVAQTPSLPVETRQDVVVSNGTNTLIPISRSQINRIVTPFEDPQIQTVSSADISTKENVIYVTTDSDQPVTMFVTPAEDESVAISLTLLPQAIPPMQANLIVVHARENGSGTLSRPSHSAYSGQAKKWERSQPFMSTLRDLMRDLALGKLPKGYSFGALKSGDKIPACSQPGVTFDFSKSQLIMGHDMSVYVAVAENISVKTIEFDHGSCTHPNRVAVASWPEEILEPGQKTEVFLVTRVPLEIPKSSTRPSLLN